MQFYIFMNPRVERTELKIKHNIMNISISLNFVKLTQRGFLMTIL